MIKSLIIVGAGTGISSAVANRFGDEGYRIGLISRDKLKTEKLLQQLSDKGVTAFYQQADAGNIEQLQLALTDLSTKLGGVSILLYNAAVLKGTHIMQLPIAVLMQEFQVNVAAALASVQVLFSDLKLNKGAVLFTGGGLASNPSPLYGSLSIGKAGLTNLALQLNERLSEDDIYAGILTIKQKVDPSNPTNSPEVMASLFWNMAQERKHAEIII
jgi:short-subunit dehydrogenase